MADFSNLCGIAGFTHFKKKCDASRIREITRSLVHRGPDQQGVWESGDVSLGAVRLKIIDLEHGRQPMLSDDGDTVLVFNGEIYNNTELRRELQQRGHVFDSRCDTETVLRAFLEWDVDAFAKLRGMFAAALWTESQRRLVLVRDRMGIKPLYYSRRSANLYFGSELKTILLHPEIERRIDPTALDHYLSLNYVPGPLTMVEGIEKLPPGNGSNGAKAEYAATRTGNLSSGRIRAWIWNPPRTSWIRCCARRSANTWFRMCPWAYGPAVAWIPRRFFTTQPRRRKNASRHFRFPSPDAASMNRVTSARWPIITGPSITSST